jgi:DNA polymerase III subunit epsilon
MRQIVLDTETTGLSADAGDRVIEIGCVELLNRKLTGRTFHSYLNPERESHEDALKVHGISNEFLLDKPKFIQISEEFISFIQGAELIIHNASFDVGFLNKELESCGVPPLKDHVQKVIDTLSMAKEVYPGKRNSLDALCDRLGVNNSARKLHGALLDAELLADVYVLLTRGQNNLMMDEGQSADSLVNNLKIDLTGFKLLTVIPSQEELSAHEVLLVDIDKASNGKTMWRTAAV